MKIWIFWLEGKAVADAGASAYAIDVSTFAAVITRAIIGRWLVRRVRVKRCVGTCVASRGLILLRCGVKVGNGDKVLLRAERMCRLPRQELS